MTFPWRERRELTLGTYELKLFNLPLFTLPYRMSKKQAKTHWHILGTSGSGKSYFLANLFLELYEHGLPATLIDPHGDLTKLILLHLVARGVYKNPQAYEDILYLDIPEAERQNRYLPYNILLQEASAHTTASNFTEAMHRAFPELARGAAIFDMLLPRAIRVLIANNLPITALELFFLHEQFRENLLARVDDEMLLMYFRFAFDQLRKTDQLHYAGSVMRRAAQLSDLPIFRYSFSQGTNLLDFRAIINSGKSTIINLVLPQEEATRLFGCLMTVSVVQAAKARAGIPEYERIRLPSHHLIVDEFHTFMEQSGTAFSQMLSQTRKYDCHLVGAHQFWGQTNAHLRESMQNAGIEVGFNQGRSDAEYSTKIIGRVDPMSVKHEVKDEKAVDRTHPAFYSLTEQWEAMTQHIQDLPQRTFFLKRRNKPVQFLKTVTMQAPNLDTGELAEVEQEYLNRYFTPVHTPAQKAQGDTIIQLPATADTVVYKPGGRRERLQSLD
jgi:hypothetical protein